MDLQPVLRRVGGTMGQPKCGVYGHKGLNTPANDHNCVIFKKYIKKAGTSGLKTLQNYVTGTLRILRKLITGKSVHEVIKSTLANL